jgi:hypothetical protein
MDRNEIEFDPRHLGVPSGASNMIFEPMIHSVQTMHLSCEEINSNSKRTETSFHLTHVTLEYHRVCQNDLWAYGMFSANYAPTLCQDVSISKWTEMIFEPMVRLAQTMHTSCVEINMISK